jgi:glycosyltransferase involved in cell wall biosynthesis
MNQMETTRIGIAGDGEGNGSWIVHLSTYPPRKCGIATFTKDLLNAMDDLLAANVETRVVAMNASAVLRHHYPGKVIHEISHERENEYVDAAKELNQQDTVKLVNVQHEFGIFGGDHGLYLLPFLQTLKKPKVINFHTVLPDPDEELLSVVRSLDETIDGITVMTTRSRRILEKDYKQSRQGSSWVRRHDRLLHLWPPEPGQGTGIRYRGAAPDHSQIPQDRLHHLRSHPPSDLEGGGGGIPQFLDSECI